MGAKNHSVRFSRLLLVVVLIIVFIPCILSSIFGVFINSAVELTVYWGVTAVLVLLAVQQKHKLYLTRGNMSWLIIWLTVWAFSIFRNGDIVKGFYGSSLTMLAIIIVVWILSTTKKPTYKQVFTAIKILLTIQLIAGTYFFIFPQQLAPLGASFYHLEGISLSKFNGFVRSNYFMGLVTHYSTSGIYMAEATILLFAECVESKLALGKVKKRKLIALILFGIALVLTQKRAHLVFSGLACIAMYLIGYVNGDLGKQTRQILVGILVITLILVLIVNIPAFSGVIKRFLIGDSLEEASSGRISGLWKPAWNAFKKNWGLGIGWSRFKWLYPVQQGTSSVNNNVHNIYLQLLCENGIIFGGIIIALLLYIYLMTWRNLIFYKKVGSKATEYLPILFSFGYQTFFLLYGFTGNPLYDIETLYPYMICSSISFRYAYSPRTKLQIQ